MTVVIGIIGVVAFAMIASSGAGFAPQPDVDPGFGPAFGEPCEILPGESDDEALDRCYGPG